MYIYLQDKRARKQIPARGTKKYPMFFIGAGLVEGKTVYIDNGNGIYLIGNGKHHGRKYRAFAFDETADKGIWVNNPRLELVGCKKERRK